MTTTQITVRSGQSLWSIARERLPGASAAQLQRAVAEIAQANALSPSALLAVGQRLALPDTFGGRAARGDTTVADAVSRLSATTGPGNTPLAVRLGAAPAPRPLLGLAPTLAAAPRAAVGPVALAPMAGVPVDARVERFVGVRSMMGSAALETLDVRFGRLTATQFEDLKASFGGRTGVRFDPAREYAAVDFLPPALQALLGKDLDCGDPVTLPGTAGLGDGNPMRGDLKIGVAPNCHGTAWEAMRAFQGMATDSVALFYGEMIRMDDLVSDDKAFRSLGLVPANRTGDLATLGLQPGDVVQFSEVTDWARMTTLLHSAVYVGNGLFFEKPNTEGADVDQPDRYREQEETPYRLVTLDMMTAPVAAAVAGRFTIEALRPTTPLPPPEQAFGSGLEQDVRRHAAGRGAVLDARLVVEFEQGAAGNIRAEHATALIDVPLRRAVDGSTVLG